MSEQGAEVQIWMPRSDDAYQARLWFIESFSLTGVLRDQHNRRWDCYVDGKWRETYYAKARAVSVVRAALASGGEQP